MEKVEVVMVMDEGGESGLSKDGRGRRGEEWLWKRVEEEEGTVMHGELKASGKGGRGDVC